LFVYSLRAAAFASSIGSIVLVVPPGEVEFARTAADELAGDAPVAAVVPGGATRQESARLGVAAAPSSPLIVLHDAARPFAPPSLFDRVAKAVADPFAGAVPIVDSPDTVKRVRDGRIVETLPREELGLAQTPQAFAAAALRAAHDWAAREDWTVTDDAMLLERAGLEVAVVAGETLNFKVTTEADLRRAEMLVASGDAGRLP
jgi:2-C-methyl-D-erythritol 4-phosphate cytidylyltransferase